MTTNLSLENRELRDIARSLANAELAAKRAEREALRMARASARRIAARAFKLGATTEAVVGLVAGMVPRLPAPDALRIIDEELARCSGGGA